MRDFATTLCVIIIYLINTSCTSIDTTTEDNPCLHDNFISKIKEYYQIEYGKGLNRVIENNDDEIHVAYYNIPEGEEDFAYTQMAIYIPKALKSEAIKEADINNDTLKDLIISIHTEGGGGGGNVWWTDLFVFINKGNNRYELTTTKTNWEISGCHGYFFLEDIKNNTFMGTSFCYAQEDGRCCPSLTYNTHLKFNNKTFEVISQQKITKSSN